MILFLCSLLHKKLAAVLIEKIYQTKKTVSDHISKHFEVCQDTPVRVVLSTLFSVFGNVVKHGLSCLIYYLKNNTKIA